MKKRLLVGIILSEMHHQFFKNASKKLQEELLSMDVDVCVFTTTALSDMPEAYRKGDTAIYDLINPEMFDGFLVYPGSFQMPEEQNRFLLKLRDEFKKPVYCLERPKYDFPTVTFKEEEGITMLVEHLCKVHHAKRIEYISSEIEDASYREELEGFPLTTQASAAARQSSERKPRLFSRCLTAKKGFRKRSFAAIPNRFPA